MQILNLPDRFSPKAFVSFLDLNFSPAKGQVWRRVLTPNARIEFFEMREAIQYRFERLYDLFCLAEGIDLLSVTYPARQEDQAKRLRKNIHDQFIYSITSETKKSERLYRIISEIEL